MHTEHLIFMKKVTNSLIAAVALLALSAYADAQSLRKILERPVNIVRSEWEYDGDRNLELNYYNEDYCNYYLYRVNDDSYSLKPGKNTIFKRMKNARYDNFFDNPTTYMFFRGNFPKDFKIDTPYAFPVKSGRRTAWRTDRRESLRTLQFRMAPGDTVYATRSGIACCTVLSRQLLICHADYTFAAYLAMHENFITPGEKVRTGQPVGIAGPTGVSVSFFFLDKNKFDGLEAAGYAYSHFTPVFRTTEGDVKPVERKMYTALVDDGLVMLDMSKREQKKYLKNKK